MPVDVARRQYLAVVQRAGVLGAADEIARTDKLVVAIGFFELLAALAVAVPFALIFIFLLRLAVRSQLAKVSTGEAGLVGLTGESRTEIGVTGGKVFIGGELWRARSRATIPAGQTVRVVKAKGLELLVEAVGTVENGSALFKE